MAKQKLDPVALINREIESLEDKVEKLRDRLISDADKALERAKAQTEKARAKIRQEQEKLRELQKKAKENMDARIQRQGTTSVPSQMDLPRRAPSELHLGCDTSRRGL